MKLSQNLWQQNIDLAERCLAHPFILGLADGSLAQTTFTHYIAQDYFFLDAFARAYSIAAAKSPSAQSFSKLHHLASGVLSELELHQSYAQSLNIELQTIQPSTSTRQYVDFLLSTAWSQSMGITVAAMAPCMRLYAYLGKSLAKQGLSAKTYYEWVETYSSQDFEDLAQSLESLIDEFSTDSSLLQSTYRYAMVCEENFFTSAFQMLT